MMPSCPSSAPLLLFVKMWYLLLRVMSLPGEPVVVLGGPILFHGIPGRALYGMNTLGRQFKQELFEAMNDYDFSQQI